MASVICLVTNILQKVAYFVFNRRKTPINLLQKLKGIEVVNDDRIWGFGGELSL